MTTKEKLKLMDEIDVGGGTEIGVRHVHALCETADFLRCEFFYGKKLVLEMAFELHAVGVVKFADVIELACHVVLHHMPRLVHRELDPHLSHGMGKTAGVYTQYHQFI